MKLSVFPDEYDRTAVARHDRIAQPALDAIPDVEQLGAAALTTRDLSRRIQAEYAEMPGLSVTLAQAQRLWAVDRKTCESVLMALTARGFLRKTTKGRFIRT